MLDVSPPNSEVDRRDLRAVHNGTEGVLYGHDQPESVLFRAHARIRGSISSKNEDLARV